jgi:hypothetical protein
MQRGSKRGLKVMLKETALADIYAELEKRWPAAQHSAISVALIERNGAFDYRIQYAGNRLATADKIVRSVLGKRAGILLL